MPNVQHGDYTPRSITYITAVKLLCPLLKGTQTIEVRDTRLVKFVTEGMRGKAEKVTFEVDPADVFSLSTKSWKSKARTEDGTSWKLHTKITAKKEGEATIHVKVEGKETNTIKLTTKINTSKDVFGKTAIKRLIDENKISLANHTACIVAADKQLGKLFNNTDFFITDHSNNKANVNTIYTRAAQIKKKGYISAENIFDAYTFKGGGNYQPKEYGSGKGDIISKYIENQIKNRIGFHVFYFTILNGYHVLTLVVDSINPCEKTYKVYDQLRDRNEKEFKNIDDDFLVLTVNNWNGAVSHNSDNTASTRFGIWKMQRL